MKNLFLISLVILFSMNCVYAGSINQAAYKTMTGQSYRENYRLNTQPVPYWQTQANPATRTNYMNNMQRFNQDMVQYKYNMKLMRGY